ncbi:MULTISPECIES: winged helix-turn-helix domain-containing protein [unclassified Limnospira]|uniref:Two component transcriptional regulator, winged helix family n=2 Tax=Limnospira TaxID=2596745 RepID=B5VUJ9_LIMMA|nr:MULTISPECIES: winged helix-turn-helix domain-containing protein [unclassified Limnospira]EDZ97220.1 two component transcriptional regulator, winged helix family [Limnospira maxima CS-328]EKD09977.1 two component transcriptional regulator winged helix family [Arthrospira platensis C1]MDT9271749.1 winged helix-turn-helix domain-containing protein [Limnospira sp. PMC 1234.20]MDT9302476.1 winged helix-turn-helix domain-containing protein [Limnospira sp. PMC 1281.21]UWU51027.1 DNA-binding respon
MWEVCSRRFTRAGHQTMRILLTSPDTTLQNQLHQDLSRQNFVVDVATDGEEAWELIQAFMYDAVLLELLLPKLDGIAFCSRLRDVGNPVIVLLMLEPSDAETCIEGLDSGADTCLVKPIRIPELLAHLRALARRSLRRASPLLTWGPMSLNPASGQITCCGQILKVNRKEYQILELFLRHPRQMFSRDKIGDRLWTLDDELPTDATINSHIRSIRRKLEQAGINNLIQTHYGRGYCLDPVYNIETQSAKGLSDPPKEMLDSMAANIWQELMVANARLHGEIEHRKHIEARLRRSEMMLRNAQRMAHVGCWEFDVETRETYWTEELFLIHGLDPNLPAPKPEEVSALIHPDDLPLHEEAIRIPALQRKAFEVNLRIIRANDGEIRHINARGGPVFDRSGRAIKLTGTTFDVTRWLRYPVK